VYSIVSSQIKGPKKNDKKKRGGTRTYKLKSKTNHHQEPPCLPINHQMVRTPHTWHAVSQPSGRKLKVFNLFVCLFLHISLAAAITSPIDRPSRTRQSWGRAARPGFLLGQHVDQLVSSDGRPTRSLLRTAPTVLLWLPFFVWTVQSPRTTRSSEYMHMLFAGMLPCKDRNEEEWQEDQKHKV